MSVPFCGKQNGRNGASAVVQMRKSPTEDGAEVSPLVSMLGVSLRRASVLKAATWDCLGIEVSNAAPMPVFTRLATANVWPRSGQRKGDHIPASCFQKDKKLKELGL